MAVPTLKLPKDVVLQTALGLLRAGDRPLTPSEIADGIWWVDVQLWGSRAYGLTLERWTLSEQGVDLPSLAPLRQGHLPAGWDPWVTQEKGQLTPSVESRGWALDDLSRRVGEYIATAATSGPARWAVDRDNWSRQAAEKAQETPLAVEAMLELTRHPQKDWPHLAEHYAEQLAMAHAFQPYPSAPSPPVDARERARVRRRR